MPVAERGQLPAGAYGAFAVFLDTEGTGTIFFIPSDAAPQDPLEQLDVAMNTMKVAASTAHAVLDDE